MKLHQNGFGGIEALLVVVVLTVTGIAGWTIYNSAQENAVDAPLTLTDAEIRAKFECDRTGPPSYQPTDRYCSAPEQYEQDLKNNSPIDNDDSKYAYDGLRAMIGSFTGYKISKGAFPASSTNGWNDFLSFTKTSSNHFHPVTNKPLVYTNQTPEIGEIQYQTSSRCDQDTDEFIVTEITTYFAYRYRADDGVSCVSNF